MGAGSAVGSRQLAVRGRTALPTANCQLSTVLALMRLVTPVSCNRAETPDHAPAMQQTLGTLRSAIAKFRDDNGRGPHSLEELVPRYVTKVPIDPVTNSAATWRLTTEETVRPSADFSSSTATPQPPQIIEIHSGAPGNDASGKPWADY